MLCSGVQSGCTCVCVVEYRLWCKTHVLQECFSHPLCRSHQPSLGHHRQASFELTCSNFKLFIARVKALRGERGFGEQRGAICIPQHGKLESLSLFYPDCERLYMHRDSTCVIVLVSWACQRAMTFLSCLTACISLFAVCVCLEDNVGKWKDWLVWISTDVWKDPTHAQIHAGPLKELQYISP